MGFKISFKVDRKNARTVMLLGLLVAGGLFGADFWSAWVPALLPVPEFLKSVSYQPVPLS